MARNPIALGLVLLALAACGKGEADDAAQETARVAQLRARTDSVRKARKAADSLALVAAAERQATWSVCADSVKGALQKTRAGRKALRAAAEATDAPMAEVTGACGEGTTTPSLAAVQQPAAPAAEPAPTAQPAAPDAIRSTQEAGRVVDAMPPAEQPVTNAEADSIQADSLAKSRETDVLRETFAYGGGARDPFTSLIDTKSTGPELADLQLVGVYQDLRSNANTVAVLREKDGGRRHKLRVGDQLGRMRVAQIRPKDVVFKVEDFGFERQETLSLRKQEDVTP